MYKVNLLSGMIIFSLTGCFSSSSSNDLAGQECSVSQQNRLLISELERDYLWNNELPSNINPDDYAGIRELLSAVTPDQDTFSFIMSRQEYEDIYINASFVGLGFGSLYNTDENVVQVRYVYDDSPADNVGLTRGSRLTQIGERSTEEWFQLVEAGQASWDDAFGPSQEGFELYLEWERVDGTPDDAYLLKQEVDTNTIMAVERFQVADKDIGYFVFDSFINRAAADINSAFDQMMGVDELVIDLRYNSGGLIRIANQIASQTSWQQVENETFVTYQFNDNYQDESTLFNLGAGIETLDLDRVVVLTTGASCSASELIVNGLRPFVDVFTVGTTTCGKPVGQYPTEICDDVLFAVNFQSVNADGFGDYFGGLAPTCPATDTVTTDWGDPADPLLAEAFHYLENGQCSATAEQQGQETLLMQRSLTDLAPAADPRDIILEKHRRHH
ncbi:S41 family peptidase [Aliidiomarina minuta]|nr:S41 family peptidase [Aliidiomarina minuta]